MESRSLVIVLFGLILISGNVFLTLQDTNEELNATTAEYFERQNAQNLAQAGAHMGLMRLADDPSWRTGYTNLSLLGGRVTVTLTDTVFSGSDVVRVRAISTMNAARLNLTRRDTCIAYVPLGYIPGTVRAAITTNNPVKTLGNLTVDGREHRMTGALVAGRGTNGIWTTRTLSQSGSSTIGGTAGGTDYAPAKPGNANIIKTGQTWPGGYPGSPDSIIGGPAMGFPEGRLKAMAQSGIGGSQYVSNPSALTFPLRGVTYVELPSGGTWQSMSIDGSGILIVHNQWRNAIMKNLNSGTFKGLMIVDDPVHIHTTVIGALIALTPAPSEGNCIGNGSGTVMYSSEAIRNATATLSGRSGNGSDANVLAWWE
ncbi:MAG: hypothetical protein WB626_08420 [Bacteroidota bacterium]